MFLNISPHEWGRVVPAFFIKLLAHIALVSGSTILVVLFISKYEISALPRLFIIQALFVILGTSLLTGVLKKLPTKISIIGASLISAFCLILTTKLADGSVPFFFVALLGISVFLAQISIWISIFIEDLFSPLEGERTLPVIESAEPLGGIFAGVLMVSFIGKIPTEDMFLAVGIVLLLIPPFLVLFLKHINSIPVLKLHEDVNNGASNLRVIPDVKKIIYKSRFLSGLFLVIFMQFFVFHFVEFQYTKKMDEVARHHTVDQTTMPEHLPEEFTVAELPSHSERLMHDLGAFQIGVHAVLFVLQLLLTATALQKLGVVRLFSLGPLLSFCSFLSLLFGFNLWTALGAKGTFDIANGISKSAFGNAFYALPERIRDEAKEILEGFARPLGLLAGTIVLLILQQLLAPEGLLLAISIILVTVSACASVIALSLSNHYTKLSKKKFETGENLPEKLNAVEILSQKGHHHAKEFLIERLTDNQESVDIRIKILEVIGRLQKTDFIPNILGCCHDEDPAIRLAAVEALANYKNLGDKFFTQAFSRYSVLTSLKDLFTNSKDKKVKLAAIKVFANLNDPEIIPFLVEILKTADPELRAESISVCGLFHDPGTISHIERFLNDEHPKVVAAACIALWQFLPQRVQLVTKFGELLESTDTEAVICGIDCVGETGCVNEKPRLEALLRHDNERIRRHAIVALAKMNVYHVLSQFIDFIFHEEKVVGLEMKKFVVGLQPKYRRIVEIRITHEVGKRVTVILKQAGTSVLEYLPTAALDELLHLFHLVDAERELWNIRLILEKRARNSESPAETLNA